MPFEKYKITKYGSLPPRPLVGGSFALIAIVVAWLCLAGEPDRVRKPLPETAPAAIAPAVESVKPLKLVYRNSVIPGGVRSAADLAAVVQRDPVVAAHYANFDVAAARLVPVEKSRMVHVSYRIGDTIYWTKNKVRLVLGENLLFDGKHLTRARCGNRIADEPQGPVLDNEPAPEVLDATFVSSEDLMDQLANTAATEGLAPALAGAATTAATIARRSGTRIASSMNTVFQNPASMFPAESNLRSLSQLATAPRADAIATAPAVIGRSDVDDAGAAPAPAGTPPANPAPEGGVPQFPVPAVPANPADPVPEGVPQQFPTPAIPAPPAAPTPGSPLPFTPSPAPGPQPVNTPSAEPTPVPEPGSAALAGLALVVLMLVRRKRQAG
jgi:hypothetical protein